MLMMLIYHFLPYNSLRSEFGLFVILFHHSNNKKQKQIGLLLGTVYHTDQDSHNFQKQLFHTQQIKYIRGYPFL